TTRAVTRFAVEMIDPKLGETVLDPACGTGGFLTCAIEHVRKRYVKSVEDDEKLQRSILGVDKKQLPHLLAVTNMELHRSATASAAPSAGRTVAALATASRRASKKSFSSNATCTPSSASRTACLTHTQASRPTSSSSRRASRPRTSGTMSTPTRPARSPTTRP